MRFYQNDWAGYRLLGCLVGWLVAWLLGCLVPRARYVRPSTPTSTATPTSLHVPDSPPHPDGVDGDVAAVRVPAASSRHQADRKQGFRQAPFMLDPGCETCCT